jgi:hypothetical protein
VIRQLLSLLRPLLLPRELRLPHLQRLPVLLLVLPLLGRLRPLVL